MARAGFDDVVLLTGLPSFYARRLCEGLLEVPKTLVHAVVPETLTNEAEDFRASLPLEQRARLHLLAGDAASMDMGLSGAEYRELAGEIDRIHHSANVSYLGVDERTAEQVNVGGAREAVEMGLDAEASRRSSTTRRRSSRETAAESYWRTSCSAGKGSPTPRPPRRRAPRSWRAGRWARCRSSSSGRRSSWATRRRARSIASTGLTCSCSCRHVAARLRAPAAGPRRRAAEPRAHRLGRARSVALGRDPRAVGKTFHLVDPNPLSARRVFELVARAGGRRGPRGFIPANLAKALLRAPGLERIAKSPRAFLETLTTPVTYDARNTAELLPALGIPAPLRVVRRQLVEYVQERVRQRREKASERCATRSGDGRVAWRIRLGDHEDAVIPYGDVDGPATASS